MTTEGEGMIGRYGQGMTGRYGDCHSTPRVFDCRLRNYEAGGAGVGDGGAGVMADGASPGFRIRPAGVRSASIGVVSGVGRAASGAGAAWVCRSLPVALDPQPAAARPAAARTNAAARRDRTRAALFTFAPRADQILSIRRPDYARVWPFARGCKNSNLRSERGTFVESGWYGT